jgi:hypothetical protein
MKGDPATYCITFTDLCRPMADWGIYWQAIGVIAATLFGTFGLIKIISELKQISEKQEHENRDRERAAKLSRTEFFLSQHRRLFDNEDLYDVLCLLDGDEEELTDEGMPDKKRKFLTFIEEMALLVNSGQINREVAFYMFGYYAICARNGVNFAAGMDMSLQHWSLFFDFANNAEVFLDMNPDGPEGLSL